MSKLDLGRIGMTVPVSADGRHLDDAAALEGLGYSAIWLRGGQIDSLSRIAEVVRATTAVPVVPGIIPVDVSPAAAAAARLPGPAGPGRTAGAGRPADPGRARSPQARDRPRTDHVALTLLDDGQQPAIGPARELARCLGLVS